MKAFNFLVALFVISSVLCPSPATADTGKSGSFVRHMVSVKFKETTTPEQVQQVLSAFKDMKTGIPEIYAMEFGPDVSVEHKNKGFTHGFLLTFANEKDRDTYLVHPVHKNFLALAKPLLDDIFVIDILTAASDKKINKT
ncbi:MAG: Dabb family protein [Candidatus Obscuribacterales bacterium]|nr:Dabb family protein [Candidatus Obscuribacterales bacterium]